MSSRKLSLTKGLDVLRRKPGVNHPAYSASLVAYAFLQADLGHYSVAEKLYDESGKLLLRTTGRAASGLYHIFEQSRGPVRGVGQPHGGRSRLSQSAGVET